MESIWRSFILSEKDDWTKTKDPAERRKIQNRLSQRAKRAKKVQIRKPRRVLGEEHVTSAMPTNSTGVDAQPFMILPAMSDHAPNISDNAIISDNTLNLNDFSFPVAGPATDTKFLIFQPVRCFMAFARIIDTLRLGCDHTPKVFDIGFDVPSTLKPVKEQLEIPHLMHVDILPWPILRSNFLKRMATINQVEFVADMQNDQLKVWGDEPWDIMGWEMSADFVKKWWFLLDASMLQSTNFWRKQQGLRALQFPDGWKGNT